MKKMAAGLVIVIGLCLCIGNVYAAEDKEVRDLSREKKSFRNYSGPGSTSVSSFCIEGHVFVMLSGDVSNAQSLIQVYEEKSGKVVPMRCK